MKVLVAEDDPVYRGLLSSILEGWGYEPQLAEDGLSAWGLLQEEGAAKLALVDWIMPGLDGIEVCRRVRARPSTEPTYLILLTARDATADIVVGLESGANDYVTKPFEPAELQARLRVGRNVVELQGRLACRIQELEDALSQVKQLRGLLPICSYCKMIRDDGNYWQQVEQYIARHADVKFSHGICPQCWEKEVKPQLDQLRGTSGGS